VATLFVCRGWGGAMGGGGYGHNMDRVFTMISSDTCKHGSCGCKQQDRGKEVASKVRPVLDHTLTECGERQSGEVPLQF
jgi:hypothetical protein